MFNLQFSSLAIKLDNEWALLFFLNINDKSVQ